LLGVVAILEIAVVLVPTAQGQGFIVDRRPRVPITGSFEIREVNVDARVRDQVAEVRISQTFHNPGSSQLDAEYLFPLPDDGAIQNFVLMVDGHELPGRVLPKDEARRIYEDIVRTKRDPALLEFIGRGVYRTSVFPIPPGSDRTVTMRYTQLCKRDRDIIEFSYPLSTQKFVAKPIERLIVQLSIQNKEAIKSVYCPTDDVRIDRSGDHDVRVSFERRDIVPSNDFRLLYTLADGAMAASVLSVRASESEDGYFLVLASPEVRSNDTKPLPKSVIFVLDRSGSMNGKKIEQARNALKTVLNNFRDDDLFNIVVYDDRVQSFKPELERYNSGTRDEAARFVDNIRAGGSTNIDAALGTALGMIHDASRPAYILFLTDGLPTAGEVRELPIADNCRRANAHKARVFCFGVGYDVNARLLDRLSGGNSGTSEYVKPDEDIESHVGRFYSKMTSPVLSGLRVELAGVDINRTYPRDLPDLFEGGQIVWAGRYRQSGPTKLRVTGYVGTERRTLEFPAELASASSRSSHDFVERLWVVRRLGDLIDQIDLHGQNKELVDELVALSTKYGILTPYTSFLADERVQLHALSENTVRSRRALDALGTVDGQFGIDQRGVKNAYINAQRAGEADAQTPALAGIDARLSSESQARKNASSMSLGRKPAGNGGGRMVAGPLGGASGMGGMAGAMMRPGAPAQGAAAAGEGALHEAAQRQRQVRQIGDKTFYWKNSRWVDSSVKPDEEAKATVVTQLTDAYFELARTQKAEFNRYLSQAEPVTVKLDGKVYRVEPPAAGTP
jgi:Ca-activated chloride channel family protein